MLTASGFSSSSFVFLPSLEDLVQGRTKGELVQTLLRVAKENPKFDEALRRDLTGNDYGGDDDDDDDDGEGGGDEEEEEGDRGGFSSFY